MSKKENIITVCELNTQIKNVLGKNISEQIKVKGELSNIKISGPHVYLTLKDIESSISVVFWNTKLGNFSNGDDVIITGKIACFIKGGSYQLSGSKIERIGIGNLHELLENNKKSFLEKGYFDKSKNKLDLPNKINSIGILTAKEGAALQDILYVLKKNMFNGKVFIKNCMVQGQMCPESVKTGIEYFNQLHKSNPIDVLIISRGGGSFEDLIGYSSKEVVKAIHKTPIYTISAVGHEVDTMLSDYTADYRAPTPSVAGDVVSCVQKKRKEELDFYSDYLNNIKIQIHNMLKSSKDQIKSLIKLSNTINPLNLIANESDKLNKIKNNLNNFVATVIKKNYDILEKMSDKNESFNPSQIFENGYVAIVDEKNNLINTLESFNKIIKKKQKLKIVFTDGEVSIDSLMNNTSTNKSNVKSK